MLEEEEINMRVKVVPYPTTILFNIEGIDIIGNYKTGSMVGLSDKGFHFIRKALNGESILMEDLDADDIELLKALFKYEIVHDDSIHIEGKNEIDSAYLHITNKCNLHCIGCYSRDNARNKEEGLSLEIINHIIEELKKYSLKNLIISGGEPFLRNDLDEIVKYAKEEIMVEKVVIITNGTIIKESVLYNIKPYVDYIAVSIDGFNGENATYLRDSGIFNKVIQTIKLIKSSGISVNILPTLHKKNIYHIEEYIKLAKSLNVSVSFSLLTCNFNNLKECKDFVPSTSELIYLGKYLSDKIGKNDISVENISVEVKRSCEAGKKLISIAANGDVYPCHMLHVGEFSFGNIVNTYLEEVLNSSNARRFRDLHVDDFKECKNCKYRYLCGGGCRANAFYSFYTLFGKDSYCSMYTEYYKYVVNMLKSLKREKNKIV